MRSALTFLAVSAVAAVCLSIDLARVEADPSPAPAPAAAPTSRPAGAAERIVGDAIAWLDAADKKVDELVAPAEAAAERLIAGGNLYVAGNPGFIDEMFYRAGGFPFTKEWAGEALEDNDVLLIGHFRPNETNDRHARLGFLAPGRDGRFRHGQVVHIASHRWPGVGKSLPLVDRNRWNGRLTLIDTGTDDDGSLAALSTGQLATTALAWAFSGEVISAATRKHKTLATYASDWEPNGHEWDASVKGHNLHPTISVPPIPARRIGREYLRTCRGFLAGFLADEPPAVRRAGRQMAACLARGGTVWATVDGHIHARGDVVPRQLTGVVMTGRSFGWWPVRQYPPAGDLVLQMGYLRYPGRTVDSVLRRGAEAVVVAVDDGPNRPGLTNIRGHWKNYDTIIELPNYPIRVLAASGTVQTPQWYALMAETLAAQKDAGKPERSPAPGRAMSGD